MATIQELVLNYSHYRGPNAKGWHHGDAVCCHHNGETKDKRGRGGLLISASGRIAYNCFNCSFSVIHEPGQYLSQKFRKLLYWMGVDDSLVHHAVIEAMREKERRELLGLLPPPKEELVVKFNKVPLPEEATSLLGIIDFYELKGSLSYLHEFMDVVEYLYRRRIDMKNTDYYWSSDTKARLNQRVIIPFYWKGEMIGYTARAITEDMLPKYLNQVDSGFVFNVDKQKKNWKFVIVCEGIFDAISIDGVAVMQADVTTQQINIIEDLDREIIVVPDFDKAGGKLIDVALENHWSVAFPVWGETCKDINEAVVKYGKMFVLKTILDSVERSQLKIRLLRKKYGS